jgi:competence protein ComEA
MRRARVVACLIGLAGLVSPSLALPAWAGKAVDGVVNLNTAEVAVLGLLPGVGPAKAAQIVAYRKRHPFRTVDELVRIKGIGRKMVRRLRVHLAVSGPTTATGMVVPAGAAPPPPPTVAPRPPLPAPHPMCVRPPLAQRQKREPRPTHGACPRSP